MSGKYQFITTTQAIHGFPHKNHFKFVEGDIDELKEGQLLVKPIYLSVDPYLRNVFGCENRYGIKYNPGDPIVSRGYGRVIKSKSNKICEGEYVLGQLQWANMFVAEEESVFQEMSKVDPEVQMSICGMTGLTAYFGLIEHGQIKKGETILISAGAGAVGSTVGQLAKLMGCKIIGIGGSDRKINFMLKEIGFDQAINYKRVEDIKEAIKNACPEGYDLYFDNVGGATLDAAVQCLKPHGRIVNCGAISTYNFTNPPTGLRLEWFLIQNRLKMEGFIVWDHKDQFHEKKKELLSLYQQGKIKNYVQIFEGLDSIIDAFLGLFSGEKIGKSLIRCEVLKERR